MEDCDLPSGFISGLFFLQTQAVDHFPVEAFKILVKLRSAYLLLLVFCSMVLVPCLERGFLSIWIGGRVTNDLGSFRKVSSPALQQNMLG